MAQLIKLFKTMQEDVAQCNHLSDAYLEDLKDILSFVCHQKLHREDYLTVKNGEKPKEKVIKNFYLY